MYSIFDFIFEKHSSANKQNSVCRHSEMHVFLETNSHHVSCHNVFTVINALGVDAMFFFSSSFSNVKIQYSNNWNNIIVVEIK